MSSKIIRQFCCYTGAVMAVFSLSAPANDAPTPSKSMIKDKIVIDTIWSAVPVGFCLYTHKDNQYVAYYNADRRMVVAQRKPSDKTFTKYVLPSKSEKPPGRRTSSTVQGWDSHNYITMAVDEKGHLHLSGNMHAGPLTYFRSTKPGDVTSLVQVDAMVGKDESRCTYPKFMTSPKGGLLFHYRQGGSGNGFEVYNLYDAETQTWSRFLDTPLITGKGKDSAYQRGPKLGPDGHYHLLWLWRKTPDAATCHNLCYARSRDLKAWETIDGKPLKLPITLQDKDTIIDPVPINGGILNTCHHFSFDSKNRVVVSYYKYDKDGNSQAYVARHDGEKWSIKQVSDWKHRHIFRGGGSGPAKFGTSLSLRSIRQHDKGTLALPYSHWKHGSGLLVIDEDSLKPLRLDKAKPDPVMAGIRKTQSAFPGMRTKMAGDSGPTKVPGMRYLLRWETLGTNRDRPREGKLPENSELILYGIATQ